MNSFYKRRISLAPLVVAHNGLLHSVVHVTKSNPRNFLPGFGRIALPIMLGPIPAVLIIITDHCNWVVLTAVEMRARLGNKPTRQVRAD